MARDGMAAGPAGTAERSSIEKTRYYVSPDVADLFQQLPDEIIEQILLATDPNGFASLALLNRKWRAVSQHSHIYHHHLARCVSYLSGSGGLPPADDDNLPLLRRLFAREVKRNLFDAYLRPRETVYKLVSNSISSSSCPGGEGMQFAASPLGHHLLAYNSSRLYVVDVRQDTLKVKRELKILRRPASACITDDANLLAVLSTEMQVDLYDLTKRPPQRKHSLLLDNKPRAIAISSCGSVLAAAYDGGIEVSSLHPNASSTDSRAVKCDAVDNLAFSPDGSQILGTTIHSTPPSTVILTAPYYDPGSQFADNLSAMWTTSILFPNTSRDCSHAILLQDGTHGEAEWTFTYDRSFETFRAVRFDDLRNGTTYFTGPNPKASDQSKLLPCTLPSATFHGDLVSSAFQASEVWMYGLPRDLAAVPVTTSDHDAPLDPPVPGRHSTGPAGLCRRASTRTQESEAERIPQWQLLCDNSRNNVVSGRKITELAGLSSVKWVAGFAAASSKERLVITARGVAGPRLVTDEEDVDFVDGSRVTLLDFDYGLVDGHRNEVTIDVGTDDAEVLEEETRDIEAEVAIIRRRTVAQKRAGRHPLLRATTTLDRESAAGSNVQPDGGGGGGGGDDDDPLAPRIMGKPHASRQPVAVEAETASIEEQEALDAPYAHASPRSGTTLRRAATAAAANRRLNPTTADGRPIEYRRADGRDEHPHESDADNWVPPPPPYQKEDPGDLPAFMRGPSVAPLHSVPPLPLGNPAEAENHVAQPRLGRSHQRTASDSTTLSRRLAGNMPRPRSSPSIQSLYEGPDDLYDVSPPASPSMSLTELNERQLSSSYSNVTAVSMVSSSASAGTETFRSRPRIPSTTSSTRSSTPTVGNDPAGPSHPPLEPHFPDSPSNGTRPAVATERRLVTSRTWPLQLPSHAEASPLAANPMIYPVPAPLSSMTAYSLENSLPPAPSSGQLASLNKRMNQGNPRQLSGGMHIQQALASSANSECRPGHRAAALRQWQSGGGGRPITEVPMPEYDCPLIISTPKGVSGAFDSPSRRTSGRSRTETQILSPIPQHPRLNSSTNAHSTVERLETIYRPRSLQSGQSTSAVLKPKTRSKPKTKPSALPGWLRSTATPLRMSPTGVSRQASKAKRSAAKNMQDARKKGWTGKKKKQRMEGQMDSGVANVAPSQDGGWRDVSPPLVQKGKKCVVM
ncbi:F-box domain protein [Drechmeria coniospora]|uniref:F-box domain protein n=1 Tax=Drechmeria coniospora TaxID=98403 RepID=A0A151GB61_DRECN|nr:F-box domain protein [Drechmeria coniospora]KYK54350.1 F-box domain protein [Drechmeria coniospora]